MEIINPNTKIIENQIRNILHFIGEDENREGLVDTPKRMIKSWDKLFGGYKENPENVMKTFTKGVCDEMVILKNIEFYSTCEHHFLPFFGKISIGYIPDGKVIGISKLARLVEIYSRRLQIQERMTTQIAEAVQLLKPLGVIVVVEAQHFCMIARGVEKQNSIMITSAIRGMFKKDIKARQEFMELIS